MDTVTAGDAKIPVLGMGTWPMTGDRCRTAVETALELGYRHVDTAQMYDNEEQVGNAIANADVAREDVFVVTKLLRKNLAADHVHASFERSLDRLGLSSVDLLLIHSPSSTVPIAETIGAMNDLQERGVVDHIGVSNFSVDQLDAAIDASRTPIVTNQVKYHPYESKAELLEYCIANDVALTAYSPLAKGKIASDETLSAIGDRYGKTASQVALRWLIQQPNVVAIPKAASRTHLEENLDVFDFELTDAEMETVFDLQEGLLDRLRDAIGL